MSTLPSIDVRAALAIDLRAAEIRDSVVKLQFLRHQITCARASRARGLPVASILAAVFTTFVMVASGSNSPAHATFTVGALTKSATFSAWPVLSMAPPSPPSREVIWVVERKAAYWVYSNGLQVRTEYLTESTIRHYVTWSRGNLAQREGESIFPAGIVFHTTESLMLPLEIGQARSLVKTREAALDYIRRGRLYNYVIDRFGQVFRVVPDDQVAFHAGHSVWADDRNVYEGLNDSFLGVAFEAGTNTSFVPNAAQIRSGRMLTDILRSAFSIAASNCVTHAQVSVNPSNMEIGYHTDWAANFPFGEFGLPDGYTTPLPSVELFGFSYNHFFVESIGGKPWAGLLAAEDDLRRAAEARNIPAAEYRALLQRKYQAIRSQKNEPTDRDWT